MGGYCLYIGLISAPLKFKSNQVSNRGGRLPRKGIRHKLLVDLLDIVFFYCIIFFVVKDIHIQFEFFYGACKKNHPDKFGN